MNHSKDAEGITRSTESWTESGAVSCREVDRNGFVTVWTARWEVLDKPKDGVQGPVILHVSGCGDEFDIHLDSTRTGMCASIPELDVSCQLEKSGDAGGNVGLLKPLIGMRNALTACHCIHWFATENGWGADR